MGGGVSLPVEEDSALKDGIRSAPVTDPVVAGPIIGQEAVDGHVDTIDGAAAWVAAWRP